MNLSDSSGWIITAVTKAKPAATKGLADETHHPAVNDLGFITILFQNNLSEFIIPNSESFEF